ncbi:MAG: helix-turn-helix transcriptional regulator [Bacteroidales bacterium]|nr:helix-turn-helix transcriptional regulator [Bacteroidales bacterium]
MNYPLITLVIHFCKPEKSTQIHLFCKHFLFTFVATNEYKFMGTIEARLKQFLQMEELSPAKFADSIGIQRSGISHLLAGRNKPSYDFITKMLTTYPDLNADWLLTGKGKPYKNSSVSAPSLPPNDSLFDSQQSGGNEELVPEDIDNEFIEASDFNSQPSENPIFDDFIQEDTPKTDSQTCSSRRRIVRVTIFYSDGTYEEK